MNPLTAIILFLLLAVGLPLVVLGACQWLGIGKH